MAIAIIIPTYKPSWYLIRCLKSIDAQTLDKNYYTVYIALNGPRGKYENLILNALKKCSFNYKYFYLQEKGVSNARNFLIDNSDEDYITFVDDDDVLSSNYLEELLRYASRDCMSVSNVLSFSESVEVLKSNFVGNKFKRLEDLETSLFKTREFFSAPWGKLLNRDIIGSTRFDKNLKIGEDSLFMAELSKQVKEIRKTNKNACYYVYEREGSASRKKVPLGSEVKRVSYLIFLYSKMLFQGYNFSFILSRIIASIAHLKKIFQ